MENLVAAVLNIVMVYLLLGLLFAIVFIFKGASAIDEDAVRVSFWFKLLILPASVVFWPWLLGKWIRKART